MAQPGLIGVIDIKHYLHRLFNMAVLPSEMLEGPDGALAQRALMAQ